MHPIGTCTPGGCLDGAADRRGARLGDLPPLRHRLDVARLAGRGLLGVPRRRARDRARHPGRGRRRQRGAVAAGRPEPATSSRPPTSTCSASRRPTPTGAWAPFSNFLPTNDVSAPGVGVYAAIAQGFDLTDGGQSTPTCDPLPGLAQPGWCQVDGTSFATPITAAAAAWVWSARRGLTRAPAGRRAARRRSPGHGRRCAASTCRFGFGLLDVARVAEVKAPAPDLLEPNGDVPMVTGQRRLRQAAARHPAGAASAARASSPRPTTRRTSRTSTGSRCRAAPSG